MKLQASINRLGGAQNNIRNGISFLEVQDGLLAFAGRIVDRMSELKGLSSQDPMKASLDQASYNDEFKDLQIQLYEMSKQTFNGVSLFADQATDNDTGLVNATRAQFRGTNSEDNTLTIFTSPDGNDGSKVSLSKSWLLSALTINTGNLNASLFNSADNSQAIGATGVFTFASKEWKVRWISIRFRSAYLLKREHIASLGAENRGHYVQAILLGRDDLADEIEYESRIGPHCGCRYRRGEHKYGEVQCLDPGLSGNARPGKLNYGHRPDALTVTQAIETINYR